MLKYVLEYVAPFRINSSSRIKYKILLNFCITEMNTKAFAFFKPSDEFIPNNFSFNLFKESNVIFMLTFHSVKCNAFSFQIKINVLEIYPTAVMMPFFL